MSTQEIKAELLKFNIVQRERNTITSEFGFVKQCALDDSVFTGSVRLGSEWTTLKCAARTIGVTTGVVRRMGWYGIIGYKKQHEDNHRGMNLVLEKWARFWADQRARETALWDRALQHILSA
jgi:hypothetical protein